MEPITPQDVLADGADGTMINGTYVRKGSIAAFIQNAKLLAGVDTDSAEFQKIADQIRAIKPALDALDIFEVFTVRDPRVVEILASASH
ncbi:MAG: hypothetical protein ABWY93_19635 [Mycobacterium sp.]